MFMSMCSVMVKTKQILRNMTSNTFLNEHCPTANPADRVSDEGDVAGKRKDLSLLLALTVCQIGLNESNWWK